MPENVEIPSSNALNDLAGCYGSEIARARQRIAYRSIAHQLTEVFNPCAQTAELISTTTIADVPPGATGAGSLLDHISKAEQALEAVHDLAANGRARNKVREMGHRPVPAWRSGPRPPIVAREP